MVGCCFFLPLLLQSSPFLPAQVFLNVQRCTLQVESFSETVLNCLLGCHQDKRPILVLHTLYLPYGHAHYLFSSGNTVLYQGPITVSCVGFSKPFMIKVFLRLTFHLSSLSLAASSPSRSSPTTATSSSQRLFLEPLLLFCCGSA